MRISLGVAAVALFVASYSLPAISETDQCAGAGLVERVFMTHRQLGGYNLSLMLEKFGSDALLKDAIIAAWEYPLMPTAATKEIAIAEFGNRYIIACHKAAQ